MKATDEFDPRARALVAQGLAFSAAGLAGGLALEALIGFKVPALLDDPLRRELFRLAHAHLTLLGLLCAVSGLAARALRRAIPRSAARALRAGALLLPLGFFLGGLSHPEGDPGPGVFLAPLGGLLALYGLTAIVLALRRPE